MIEQNGRHVVVWGNQTFDQSPPMLAPWVTPNCSNDDLIDDSQQEGQNKVKALAKRTRK